eukprot:scaffold771_cov170-Amphora_coffeaeformis.AAC.10
MASRPLILARSPLPVSPIDQPTTIDCWSLARWVLAHCPFRPSINQRPSTIGPSPVSPIDWLLAPPCGHSLVAPIVISTVFPISHFQVGPPCARWYL